MARGNGNTGRGHRGQRGGRGPPRGGGRGSNYRGRGRGNGPSGISLLNDEIDPTIRTYADTQPGQGYAEPRIPYLGSGAQGYSPRNSRSNSGTNTPSRGRDSPRGRGRGDFGMGSMRGGRGAGRGGSKLRPDAPLSGLLYQERPFLRPVIFVPSVYTRTLFQEEEDILKPGVEEVGDGFQNHAPTADQVARVFSGDDTARLETSASEAEDGNEDELEEIDFNDMAKLLETSTTESQIHVKSAKAAVIEEQFTGFFIDTQPAGVDFSSRSKDLEPPEDIHRMEVVDSEHLDVLVNDLTPIAETPAQSMGAAAPPEITLVEEKFNGFYIDTDPSPLPESNPFDETRVAVTSRPISSTTTGVHGSTHETSIAHMSSPVLEVTTPTTVESTPAIEPELAPPNFYIDTDPAPVSASQALAPASPGDDEEIIVYVAPHPRITSRQNQPDEQSVNFSPYVRASPLLSVTSTPGSSTAPKALAVPAASASRVATPPSFSSISFSFTSSPVPSPAARKRNPIPTPRSVKVTKAWERKRAKRTKQAARSTFGAYGAMMEEALLHGGPREDKRRTERRRGDSDLDWGTDGSDGDGDEVEEGVAEIIGRRSGDKGKGKEKKTTSYEVEGMEVDPDLQLDMDAMKQFVEGLMGKNAGNFMTMDDIRDREIMRMEDEEEKVGPLRGSSDEDEDEEDQDAEEDENSGEDEETAAILDVEERMLIAEEGYGLDSDSEDDDSDNEDQTPRTSFQARLEHLRMKSQRKKAADASFGDDAEDSSDDDEFFSNNMTWAEEDDDFINEIQDMLDENEAIITGRGRKERNKLFRAVRDGDFDDMEGISPARRRKDKGKGLPLDLQAQWDKDRQKKAAYKRARELERLERAADPLAKKKGGKKGRKAMMATSKLDPTITVVPNRVIDMFTLVQQIRRFLNDVNGPTSMSLPPTNKETRKNIHEMALAFNLKSISKGKGDARYTTLQKKTNSGLFVDERKVARVIRKSGGAGSRGGQFVYNEKKGGVSTVLPRHKEGEVVGKAAPKIGEANVGFRMLASMGWSEGDRIGATGGLEVPLTAVIKNTKLGLGATR